MALIIGEVSGSTGKVKRVQYELELTGKSLEEFKNMKPEHQKDYLEEHGLLIIIDASIGYDEIIKINISE